MDGNRNGGTSLVVDYPLLIEDSPGPIPPPEIHKALIRYLESREWDGDGETGISVEPPTPPDDLFDPEIYDPDADQEE